MKYDERSVQTLYDKNKIEAGRLMASLPVAQGNEPNVAGLNGWVFEQTIRYCLCEELALLHLSPKVQEQVKLVGRVKIDLVIATTALEIKISGSFGGKESKKYAEYRKHVEERGWTYCYVSGKESHIPYRLETESMFGKDRTFFLTDTGAWQLLVTLVARG